MQASKFLTGFVVALALAISTAPGKSQVSDEGLKSLPDEFKVITATFTVTSIAYIRDCNGKTTDEATKAAWSNYISPVLKPYIDSIEPSFTKDRAQQGDVAYCTQIRRMYLDLVREMTKLRRTLK
jgi:hypothetical protein